MRVAKGSCWARRLVPALAFACLGFVLSIQVALADTTGVTVTPATGYPTTSIVVQGTYFFANGCPVGAVITMYFYFYFDTANTPIAVRVPVTACTKGLYDTGPLKAWTPPAALATVTKHAILVTALNSATGASTSNSTGYVITSPPTTPPPTTPPPTTPPPTAPPPTTPPPTTPPPTTPPPTTPPPTHQATPPPTHAPTSASTPIVVPSPRCTTEGPARGCVPVDCAHLTAAILPIGGDGGAPPLVLVLFVLAVPGTAFAVRHHGLSKLAMPMVLLLVIATSCARPVSVATSSPAPVASTHAIVGFEATPDCRGYWMASSTGGIFPFGSAQGLGSTENVRLNRPIVGMESTPDGHGYWLVSNDGRIFPFGDAQGFGSTGNIRLTGPIVAMEDTPDGAGYWLVASDGAIFPFGDAVGYGSTAAVQMSQPIVDMEATPSGHGYLLVARDGGILPYGDAQGFGGTANFRLSQPIVGMEATPDGGGYWLVAADGGIFPLGDAQGFGSTAGVHLNRPIAGMEATPDGHGYWLVAVDGAVFPFGDAAGYGAPSLT